MIDERDDFGPIDVVTDFLEANQIEFELNPSGIFKHDSSYRFTFSNKDIQICIDECEYMVQIYIDNNLVFCETCNDCEMHCVKDENNTIRNIAKKLDNFVDNTFVILKQEIIVLD